MKLAILLPAHATSADKLIRQLKNYEMWLEDGKSCRHYFIHFSSETPTQVKESVLAFCEASQIQLSINSNCRITSYNSCLGALIELSQLLAKADRSFSFVYYHTDSDLLFRSGLAEYIANNRFAIGILGRLGYHTTQWYHAEKMRKDSRVIGFVNNVLGGSYDDLYIGRVEGMFAPYHAWMMIADVLNHYFGNTYFDDPKNHWCAEEVLYPTLFKHFEQFLGDYVNLASNVVYVSLEGGARSDRIISPSKLHSLMKSTSYFGAKWFSSASDEAVNICMKEVASYELGD